MGDQAAASDNLARALIGGGVELFDGEEPALLAGVVAGLPPPVGYASWEATRGEAVAATRDLLGFSAASEYLFRLLESRKLVKRLNIFDFFKKE
jgi:hypothetical protein